jgi:hypothetical protein
MTREKNKTYLILKIFDIQMPFLYKKKKKKALKRFRKEINESLNSLNIK